MKATVKKTWRILQPVIIIAAFYLILKNVSLSVLLETFVNVKWQFVTLFLLVSLVIIALQGVRWWILIRSFTKELSVLSALSIHFSSVFYSIILPNSTAQDVVRTIDVSKITGHSIGWSSAWITKIIGVCVSLFFSIVGLMLIHDIELPPATFYIIFGFFSIIIFSFLLSFSKEITGRFRLFLRTHFPKLPLKQIDNIREGIYRFREKKKGLLLSSAVTVIAQMLSLSSVSILLFSITGKFFLLEVIAFIPLIEMISMAQPFTPGGIGVREALMALMFRQLQLSDENLATYIILSNLIIFLKILGVIPVLFRTFKKNTHSHSETPCV
ncbi:MAG: flippase-like domain-containing protein [Chitinispirillaceae bacterium]|nr:flippase-like domain-containing protein [Chitinispirillaceae bacterium]